MNNKLTDLEVIKCRPIFMHENCLFWCETKKFVGSLRSLGELQKSNRIK